ncbi:four-carbon acid sugar kinase family protein [Deinococcus sp. SM5_A1]|uniref:four-carbon acid sugar kinase family protein n=1 Tax=Deinococcus sp. SM5_A1 TaxID=3379094 RepID=UPI00385CD3E6
MMTHAHFLIVADDLTGASDAGVHLAQQGYRITVRFQDGAWPEESMDGLVLDLDSRPLSAREAATRIQDALQNVSADLLMIKIDSTLRGPVAAQLEAALAVSGRTHVVVAPALPGNGRTTVGGVQHAAGRPVHLGPAARDPRTPVTESHLPSLLASAHGGDLTVLSRADLVTGTAVQEAMKASHWLIVDAETQGDLEALVAQVPDPGSVLWVGTAGLASALAQAYPGTNAAQPEALTPVQRGVLTVLGSLNEMARAQLDALLSSGVPGILLDISNPQATLAGVLGALRHEGSAALYSGAPDGHATAAEVATALAAVVAGSCDLVHALILVGGDTAVAVGRALSATGLHVFGEFESGVPYGRLIGPLALPVVTKAGGFGDARTLLRVHHACLISENQRINHV